MISKSSPEIKSNWTRLVFFIFIWIALCAVFYSIIFSVFPEALTGTRAEFEMLINENFAFMITSQIAIALGTFLSVYITVVLIEKKSLITIGLKLKSSLIIRGIATGFILMTLLTFTLYLFNCIQINYNKITLFLIQTLILYTTVSITEELLTRGYILNNLLGSVNKYLAIVFSSLIFGLLHFLNNGFGWIGFLNIVLFGILLSLLYLKDRNLSFPIGLHLSWNFFQGPVYGFAVSGHANNSTVFRVNQSGNNFITGGSFGPEGSIIMTVLMIAVLILIVVQHKSFQPAIFKRA